MFKIQTLNAISPTGLIQFPFDRYQIGHDLEQPDAILVRSQNMHELALPASVRVIGRAGAGVNNIPVDQLTPLGIPVLNTPGANANAVRELVIAGMLLASRNICQAWQYVNHLKLPAEQFDKQIEQDKKQFVGFELMGKTIGVIGLGSVGVKVANAALHLGMHVIGYDPTITVNRAWELSSEVKQAQRLDDLITEADFITLHVPLMDETRNLISTSQLQKMKKNVVILNFSRDGIVDNPALLAALAAQQIHSYVTDFPSLDLKNHAGVISLPHLGASTTEAEENCAVMIAKQVREYLENGSITNSVNFPTLEMPRHHNEIRLAVVNSNIPNMVGQISSTLGSANLNIISLLNKSRDNIAYTLIDVDKPITEAVLKQISSIHGVIQARVIQ